MEFLILGPIDVRNESTSVALGGIKPKAVIAVLLMHANEPVSAERLALALWGEDASRGAIKTVRVHVSRLRKALGDPDVLTTTPAGYRLRVRRGELDAQRFEDLVDDGRRALADGQPIEAATILRGALALWRGPALAEVALEPFAGIEVARLQEQRLAALELRVQADLTAGRHRETVAELQRLVVDNPTREQLAGQLMLALYRSDRQTEALATYATARRMLVEHAGVEPGPMLSDLHRAILEHDVALLDHPNDTAPPPALDMNWRALPRSLKSAAASAFVGRDAELAGLRERWMQMSGEDCVAVLVGGEAGIGKTRLAAALAQVVHREGGLVLYGRCDEGLAMPYQPFVEALRPYVGAIGRRRLRADIGELAPELGRLLPELRLGEPVRSDPESERVALFESVAALIEAATPRQRTLLVLDDLHWATGQTLLLVRHLIRCERPLRVLLLCTYRETELDLGQPLAQLLADLHRDAAVELLRLRGLGEPAIATLLEAAVGHELDDHGSPLVQVLADQTRGNPFFLRELLADVAESSAMPSAGERLSLQAMAARLEVPEGLRHVIGQRVARLSAPTGRMLRVAAVAGERFSFVVLERVLSENSTMLDALDEAIAAGLLAEAGHGTYVFTHALVRQSIYGQLSAARRMRLHRQLGETLEELDDADAHVEALAYHFAQAAPDGQHVKAADYALAAGRRAITRLGYEEAAMHYERGLQALTLSGQSQDGRRCELLLALGQAFWGTGDLDKARHACQQAAELADRLGDATALAHAALSFCGPHRFEVGPRVLRPVTELLRAALAILDEEDSALRAQLMGRLAAALASTYVDRRPGLALQALEMARRIADKATLADVLASSLWAVRGPDSLHESLALTRELGRIADDVRDHRLRAFAHWWLLDQLLELGDIDAVEGEVEALRRLTETRPERAFKWILAVVQASQAYLSGRIERCEALADDALAHRFAGDDEVATHTFGVQMFFVRHQQGRLDEVVETAESMAEQYPQLVIWRCALVSMYAQLDRRTQARQEFEALARADFSDLPRDAFWLPSVSALCGVAAFLGDVPRAQLLYGLLSPYADRCVVTFSLLCAGSAARSLGILATTLARFEEAEHHFEQALRVNTQIKSPLWTAQTQHDYARMLLRRDHRGDRHRALELVRDALATTEGLGLTALADKARPLKLRAEGGWLLTTLHAPLADHDAR